MEMIIKNLHINYIRYGKDDGEEIVLLHGWGQNIEMMKFIGDKLKDRYKITILDLPGFGSSEEPKEVLSLHGYYEIFKEFLQNLNITNPILIGHSFGGRISIIYSSLHEVKKLVLLGSPFKKSTQKVGFKIKVLRSLKKVPLINKLEGFVKKNMGSEDYKNASEIMRRTLVLTIHEDLEEYASKIKIPTLLIWGENDEAVSIEEAKQLNKVIKDSGLIVYEGRTHYAYLEELDRTINILNIFFESKN